MKVVIPLIPSIGDNIELRYTLRSLQAYYGDFELWLIGHKPKWVNGCVHVSFRDLPGSKNKECNIAEKLYSACTQINETFLYSCDDNYILPHYRDMIRHKGTILNTACETKSASYRKTCENTYSAFGNDIFDYDLHCPMWIDPVKFIECSNSFNFNQDFGLLVKSTYMNYSYAVEGAFSEDIKIRWKLQNFEQFRNVKFFSTHEIAVNKPLINFLESLFPNKSKFEL